MKTVRVGRLEISVDDRPTRKRRRRPKAAAALNDTIPMFDDQEPVIFCPYTKGQHQSGHMAPVSAFGKSKTRSSGLQPYCKKCRAHAEKRYRKRANKNNFVKELRKLRIDIERALTNFFRAFTLVMEVHADDSASGEK